MPTTLIDYKPRKENNKAKNIEPRIRTQDVANILIRIVKPDDEDSGASVSLVANKAKTSTRTVYRVLSVSTETINIDLADRLCIACGAHLSACSLIWPNGETSSYFSPARTAVT